MASIKKVKAGFKARKAADGKTVYDEDYKGRYDESTPMTRKSTTLSTKAPELVKKAEVKESFGQAFKRNKAAGAKTFTWNGNSYGTVTKDEQSKVASKTNVPTATVTAKKVSTTPKPPQKLTEAEKIAIRKKVDQNTAVSSLNKLPSSVPTRPAYKRPGSALKKGGSVKKCMNCGGKANKK